VRELTAKGGPFAEMLLEDLLGTARAWEMLHDPEVTGGLDTEAYLGLCLAAGYSQTASQKAAKEWGLKRLRRNLPM